MIIFSGRCPSDTMPIMMNILFACLDIMRTKGYKLFVVLSKTNRKLLFKLWHLNLLLKLNKIKNKILVLKCFFFDNHMTLQSVYFLIE